MDLAITAIFATLEEAQKAADCMAVCPEREHNLQISLEHCDHRSVTAASRMIFGASHAAEMLDVTPTSAAGAARTQSALLRIRCSEQLSTFAARELAALGAEKITVTPLS